MSYQDPELPILSVFISIFGAILAIFSKENVGIWAGLFAIVSAMFAIRHYYYTTKLTKRKLKKLENEEEDS